MHKYKVIIVDDERLIREGLKTYIDWSALDAEVVAVCADGLEGVRAIEKHAPAIVLTDVSMPAMDGLELLKYVREHRLPCEVVIISAYADFKYAQEALKYDAFDYVLKPLEPSPLYACMKRCIEKIEKKPGGSPEVARDTMDEWLRNVLIAVPAAESSLLELLRARGLEPASLALLTAVEGEPPRGEGDRPLCAATLSARVTVALCHSRADAEEIALANRLPAGQYRVTAGEGSLYDRFCGSLYQLWQARPHGDPTDDGRKDALPPQTVAKSLDIASMRRFLHGALAYICAHCHCKLLPIRDHVAEYYTAFYHQLEECYQSPLPNAPSLEKNLDELMNTNNLYDLLLATEALATDLYELLALNPSYNSYTRKAIQILHARYDQNLTLHAVAAELNISPAYFSTVFKENTGYPFSDYLFRYRMNIAQQMLRSGKYKIYEVGAMVGYPDVVQFSKRFKQFYHASPRNMQKQG